MSSDSAVASFVKQNPKLTGVICCILGVIVSVVTIDQGKEYSMLLDVPTVQATVVSIETISTRKGGTLGVSFEWMDPENRRKKSQVKSGSTYLTTLNEGDKIQVAVNPTEPDRAIPRGMIDESPIVKVGPLVAHNMVFLGFGFVLLGIGLVVFGKSN